MQWYTGPEGDQRVWYEAAEIEQLMAQQLRAARQRLTLETPAPDLEQFIEVHLGAELDQFAALPGAVLGVTHFEGGRQPVIQINATLTEAADVSPPSPGARGRWRATLAHEAAHVILHRYLYDPAMATVRGGDYRDPDADVLRSGSLGRVVECLHRDVNDNPGTAARGARDWREVQANRGMASLLMPESIFNRVALFHGAVRNDAIAADTEKASALVAAIAERFDVSKQAAQFRLRTFGMIA